MEITVLIADDDDSFRKLLTDILKKEGYHVIAAKDGREALDIFYEQNTGIDLVILDVMMPKLDGWEAAAEIRQNSDVALMMLTALGDGVSEIKGLNVGADDYIAKPFRYGVFLARVRSLTRKAREKKSSVISIKDLTVIRHEHRVLVGERELALSNKEYQLLLLLVTNKNMVLTREQMIRNVWGYDFDGDIRTIDTHVKTLRAKLGDAGKYIETIRGAGYRFCG